MAECEWKLYYWHSFSGRGDFVRLIFEEAGVPYDDVCRSEGNSSAVLKYYKSEKEVAFPVFAPPIIARGDFVMNQTPAILEYLGKKFGMYPVGGPEQEAHAMQLNMTVTDLIGEGHDCFHPIDKHGTYDSQKEETKPYIESFRTTRLPKYLDVLERALKANNGGQGFFFGDKITYVDIAVFHVLRATEFQFPDEYRDLPISVLRAFKQRIQERPNIKAFLESERSMPFCGNSMM